MEIRCAKCEKTQEVNRTAAGRPRLPRGWKSFPPHVLCPACKGAWYVLRAIEIPVAGPIGWEWPELRQVVLALWEQSTQCCNYVTTELARSDLGRTPADTRMPAMPRDGQPSLYIRAARLFTGLSSQTVSSIVQEVQSRYRKSRLRSRWLFTERLPQAIFPTPCPFHNASWRARWDEHVGTDGHVSRVPVVSLLLGGARRDLRLRGGAEFGRQLAGFAEIVSGQAIQGQLILRAKPARDGDPRTNGLVIGRNSGRDRERKHYRVMVKMVAYFPRPPARTQTHTLLLKTDPNALWVAEVEGHAPWILNADHLRHWHAAHTVFLQRIREDLKYEKRWPKRKRDQINIMVERRCRKHHDRLETGCKQLVALLANYAARQHVGEVMYDDSVRDYMPSFRWHVLARELARKLNDVGITLTCSTKPNDTHGDE